VAAFDFFFVPPRLTFAVSDLRSVITFVVMFVVGSAIGTLVARLRAAEEASRDRERRTAALLAFTRDAAAATDEAGVVAAVITHVRAVTHAEPRVELPATGEAIHIGVRLEGEPAVTPDQHAFVEAVVRQAEVAISRLQLATAARDAALRAKAEELRSALLSSVSHDLRTPLAAITGMATALRDSPEPRSTSTTEALDTIVEEAQRLSRLLTNLLSITKVESGAAPRRDWVPLEEIVGPALARLEPELAGREVTVDVPSTALAHVDPILVEQLLLNLLDNAAKHTPTGTPIEIRVVREPDRAILEVVDRGPGIPPAARTQVFDKFFRGTNAVPGAGLGLAVCRGIAAAHHGGIESLARDGGGTRFVAWFPDDGPVPQVEDEDEDEPPTALASAS
jgi:two-component system sensor histidine kinase KdpD